MRLSIRPDEFVRSLNKFAGRSGRSLEEMAQVFGDEVVISAAHDSEKLHEKEEFEHA